MIFNMSGGANNALYVDDILVSSPSSNFVINNLQVPGGIVNGFGLFKIGPYTLGDNIIISAYTDQTRAKANNFMYNWFDADTNGITTEDTTYFAGYGFEYDNITQTFTLKTPLTYNRVFHGRYELLIW